MDDWNVQAREHLERLVRHQDELIVLLKQQVAFLETSLREIRGAIAPGMELRKDQPVTEEVTFHECQITEDMN